MRIGVFGGTFDPVHYGHLLLAESCREQCLLDEVWLVPAATAPHKQQTQSADGQHRAEMLRLAAAGHDQLSVSTLEIERGGVSYTADTLAQFKEKFPQATLFFLMGADSLADLPDWHAPERICELAIPVVVRREGSAEPNLSVLSSIVSESRLAEIQEHQVNMPLVELSSSEIRRRIRSEQSIRYRTPRAVEKYIETHHLYR